MPMDNNSTRFLSFDEIIVDEIDIVEDAFFSDLTYGIIGELVKEISIEPPPGVIDRLIRQV